MCSCLIRLVTVDVTKDSTTCLACVYLNEYKVATAAFTLHASENKLVRVSKTREGIFYLNAFVQLLIRRRPVNNLPFKENKNYLITRYFENIQNNNGKF